VALELAEHGVTVNAICPGYVLTPLVQKQIPEQAKARGISEQAVMKDVLLAAQPTKEFVEVSQIAALAAFLCSDEAAQITGALLPIDGGWTRPLTRGDMRREDILKLPSMPASGPSYPAGPYRFIHREFMVITYESDPSVIRDRLLEPVERPLVHYEWIKMPDSSGFGDYTESGMVLPCRFKGEEANFVVQMYLDDDPPISAGREIWGFPKKYAHPKLEIVKDTLTGTLEYAGQLLPWAPWATSTKAWPATASAPRPFCQRRKST
jgi:Acetoacetate decarboxylase (ADC)/Enoyl-(Acyl carrier protein) reductase